MDARETKYCSTPRTETHLLFCSTPQLYNIQMKKTGKHEMQMNEPQFSSRVLAYQQDGGFAKELPKALHSTYVRAKHIVSML
jgi:hypothetical protein